MARTLAVGAVLTLIALLALCALARSRADALAYELGRPLLAIADASEGAPVMLQLNGLAMRLRSGTSSQPLSRVLEGLRARCTSALGVGALLPAGVATRLPGAIGDGVLQDSDAGHGFVACLDAGAAPSQHALSAALETFTRSGDVTAFGVPRLAWAERHADYTHYVVIDGAGPWPLMTALPTRGDAPGTDPRGVPRPAGARRALSAGRAGEEPALSSYACALSPALALTRYRLQLVRAGLRPLPSTDAHALWVEAGERAFAVVASQGDGEGSMLTLARLR